MSTEAATASTAPVQSSPTSTRLPPNPTLRQVQKRYAEIFHETVTEAHERVKNNQVMKGFWYANVHGLKLLELQNDPKLGKVYSSVFNQNKESNAYYHGRPPTGFSHRNTNEFAVAKAAATGKRPGSYKISEKTLPSEALKNILEGPVCFVDCQEATQIALYKLLLELWGEETFNTVFSATGKTPIALDSALSNTPLNAFVKVIRSPTTEIGDSTYFRNVPAYGSKHPNGEASGYYVVRIGKKDGAPLYAGFGLDPEGATKEDMKKVLIDDYNRDSTEIDPLFTESILSRSNIRREPYESSILSVEEYDEGVDKDLAGRLGTVIRITAIPTPPK